MMYFTIIKQMQKIKQKVKLSGGESFTNSSDLNILHNNAG